MVECAIAGTSPRSAATCARLRIDQWVMCSPRPSGSQHASISTPTRCRGGKRPGATVARRVPDDLYTDLVVPPAEVPDHRPVYLDTVRQILHDRGRIRHSQQDPGASSNTLLGASIADELLKVGRVVRGQIDRVRWSPSHPRGVALRRDYVERLVEQSTSTSILWKRGV
jgi:hypothetical protein